MKTEYKIDLFCLTLLIGATLLMSGCRSSLRTTCTMNSAYQEGKWTYTVPKCREYRQLCWFSCRRYK